MAQENHAAVTFVEFRRWKTEEVGEDDTVVNPHVLINPLGVGALVECVDPPTKTVIRMMDGRGFAVRGSYQEVLARLGIVVREVPGAGPAEADHSPSGFEYAEED